MILCRRNNLKADFHWPRIGVGVIIRSLEYYDLVKIKLTESEAEGYSACDPITYDLVKSVRVARTIWVSNCNWRG